MPLYEYECEICGTMFDKRLPYSDCAQVQSCPLCTGTARKRISLCHVQTWDSNPLKRMARGRDSVRVTEKRLLDKGVVMVNNHDEDVCERAKNNRLNELSQKIADAQAEYRKLPHSVVKHHAAELQKQEALRPKVKAEKTLLVGGA